MDGADKNKATTNDFLTTEEDLGFVFLMNIYMAATAS